MLKREDVLRPSDYLILEALTRRAMTIPELSKATQVSQNVIRERIKKFEENNLVIRGKGNKLYCSMVVWVAPAQEVVEALSGQKVHKKHPKIPEMLEPLVDAPENAQEGPQKALESPPVALPEVLPTTKVEEPWRPPKTRVAVSENAAKISQRMRVPAHLEGRGEVSVGPVARCELCPKTTPLRYGSDVVCPICARGGR